MEGVEEIKSGEKLLGYIVRAQASPPKTTFVTSQSANFQLGFVVYPAQGVIQRHLHKPLERHIVGTSEVLFVRKGRCEIDFFDDARTLVTTRELREGDIMLMLGGGHGFRLLEDTVLCEVKQGPYTGLEEKERF